MLLVLWALKEGGADVPAYARGKAPAAFVRTIAGRAAWQMGVTTAAAPYTAPLYYLLRRAHGGGDIRLGDVLGLEGVVQFWASRRGQEGRGLQPRGLAPYPGLGGPGVITSDASGDPEGLFAKTLVGGGKGAFGAICGSNAIWSRFPCERARGASSTALELHAALAGMVQFMPRGSSVYCVTDSSSAAYCINKARVASDSELQRRTLKAVYNLMQDREAQAVAVHMPRELLDLCDTLSNALDIDHARTLLSAACRARSWPVMAVHHAPRFTVSEDGDIAVEHVCAAEGCECER